MIVPFYLFFEFSNMLNDWMIQNCPCSILIAFYYFHPLYLVFLRARVTISLKLLTVSNISSVYYMSLTNLTRRLVVICVFLVYYTEFVHHKVFYFSAILDAVKKFCHKYGAIDNRIIL